MLLETSKEQFSPLGRRGTYQANEDNTKIATAIFQFVRDAARPLSFVELQTALALQTQSHAGDSQDLLEWTDVQSMCCGLIKKDRLGSVTFIHEVVDGLFRGPISEEFPNADKILAQTCVRYLSTQLCGASVCSSADDLQDRVQQNPALGYAARYWHHHVQAVPNEEWDCEREKATKGEESLLLDVLDFLDEPSSVDCAWQIMQTPDGLQVATAAERLDTVSVVLDQDGPSPLLECNMWEPNGVSGLHLACGLHFTDTVEQLLLQNRGLSQLEKRDFRGRSPMWMAAKAGDARTVSMLIKRGADHIAGDYCGVTPLHVAAYHGRLDVVLVLLGHTEVCRNVNTQTQLSGFEQQRLDIRSLSGGSSNDHHVSEQIQHSVWGRTALHSAAQNGHYAVVEAILDSGKCEQGLRDSEGMTALHKAAKNGHTQAVKAFKGRSESIGIPVEISGYGHSTAGPTKLKGSNAMHIAAEEGHKDVLAVLLEIDETLCGQTDAREQTPLHCAVARAQGDCVRVLLRSGYSRVDVCDGEGCSPLDLAYQLGGKSQRRIASLLTQSSTRTGALAYRD
jgi:ankyrin repeat protein